MPFSGFSQGAIDFLAQLSQHNERAWFEAHQAECESVLIEPAKALVEALRPRLRSLDPKIQAIPRVRGSIHALTRRQRFAKSVQPPYREYLDLWFWAGRRRAWDNSGRGVPPDHPRVTLAKHSGLFATLNGEHPSGFGTPAFVDFCATHFTRMAPLHAWLAGLLG